jgi:hypothetical protein
MEKNVNAGAGGGAGGGADVPSEEEIQNEII